MTQGGCAWNLVSQPSFTSGIAASGIGTRYLRFSVPANLGTAPRIGTIRFSGAASIQLRQNATPFTAIVTTLADIGAGSLREAITRTNDVAGSSVQFAAGLTGTLNLSTALPAGFFQSIVANSQGTLNMTGIHFSENRLRTIVSSGDMTLRNY